MKKLIISALLLVAITQTTLVLAAEPTATPSADIKSKLKALQDEIASKAAQIKQETFKKLQNRAYIGYVKSKSDTSLTLATKTETKIISVNQDTEYQVTKGKLTLKTINTDDYLVALGDIDENQVLTAKRIIKLPPPEEKEVQTSFGFVTSVGENQLTIQSKNSQLITISVDSKTNFRFGKNEGDISDVKLSKPVIVVGTLTDKNSLKARFVYIFPYTSTVKPTTTPSATPTVKLKATPTASPSAKPKK